MSLNRPRSTSVTFIRSRTSSRPDDIPEFRSDDEDIQITLAAPYIQTYLAYSSRGLTCCGISLPIPFERAARSSWWDPRFDSDILEGQYKRSAFTHLRLRFRYALFYILLGSVSWFIYFLYNGLQYSDYRWPIQCAVLAILFAIIISILYITNTDTYRAHVTLTSLFVALLLCGLSISSVFLLPVTYASIADGFTTDMSPVGHVAICVEVLLLTYTVIPLPLYVCVSICLTYSVIFECSVFILHDQYFTPLAFAIGVRILLQFCIHLIGIHIFIMTNVRMRGTFMKVGQSLLVRRQLEMEKQLKEKMIHSVMPPRVADWLMSETGEFESDISPSSNGQIAVPRNSNPGASDLKSLFRPFNMNRMENVSILFADIVGFTKMSSNKTAEELVGILNDLFERFDELCTINNCEKISTLGDCYYCVSGCPEPRPDHAKCCVEMGLSMIEAIKQFDMERNEGVNMRVGIHTGTVLCGIVGTRRFKFDVWSNDVTLANKMESTGKPGRVHISEKTCEYLQNLYLLEEGEPLDGLKTYFIIGRLVDLEGKESQVPVYDPGVHLIVSPPTSPQTCSPQTRLRLPSTNNQTATNLNKQNPNQLSPNFFRIKASSLPSILDSDTEADAENKDTNATTVGDDADNSSKSPVSTSSCGKYSSRLKNWRVPKFLFKGDTTMTNDKEKLDVGSGIPSVISIKKDELIISNGYQQVPTIIETIQPPLQQIKDVSPRPSVCNGNERPSKTCMDKNDILDIKSYISQSRSDIGHFDRSPTDFMRTSSFKSNYNSSPKDSLGLMGFDRTNSARSQHGRSPRSEGVSSVERIRSATVTNRMEIIQTKGGCLDVPNTINMAPDDQLSLCLSVNSRKDSGIKSTSRRSSIQQQIFALNQAVVSHADMLQHRVSGYYTSSQSSLGSSSPRNQSCSTTQFPPPFPDHLGECVQKLRKQSDLQLIRCVQDNTSSKRSYFIKPPLSRFTLFFKSREMEMDYRRNVYTVSEKLGECLPTLATARYNTYFDVLVSFIVFLIISLSIFLLYDPSIVWLCTFVFFACVQLCAIYLCFRQMLHFSEKIFKIFSMWYIWHVIGAILVSMPILLILINFSCINVNICVNDFFYNILILIGLIHFCNFTQLNCWMKNLLAVIYAAIFLTLIYTSHCTIFTNPVQQNISNISLLLVPSIAPPSIFNKNITTSDILNNNNNSNININQTTTETITTMLSSNLYNSEIYIDLILLLLLVWFLNREFEISYRLSFHSNVVANRDKARVQSMKNQADWLLHNIIPKHVADQLKQSAKYSENHKDVGIIFASIVNFNEMYDESYMGGKEFLRVLNELIGDFDELLLRSEFKSVDKIKTIGSTFMAASGLNPQIRRESADPYHHLYALMDFAIEMQKVIDEFNRDLLEFNLILRVGYNYGDVTAGVIGTTKLYYDIWGDAVNIASRMDTTGINGRIQVGGACLDVLEQKYEFEPRGSVYVKGKDHMNVYLLVRKKPEFLETG